LGRQIRNMVFEGGGILGISYLGVLDYMYHNGWMSDIVRVAGTSAGAVTACVTSFNLPFTDVKEIASSLDYKKVPAKTEIDNLKIVPEDVKAVIDELFGDINCIYRLINNFGWFSTEYFYTWIKEVIAAQFDSAKKRPPYTFADFKNPDLHKNNRPFWDLYIVGTNVSMKTSNIFSFETTPRMEVAEAVRISMAIPLFFEAVQTNNLATNGDSKNNVFCDGGAMNNYPLNIFDSLKFNLYPFYGVNMETLGVRFMSRLKYTDIDNLLSYIESLLHLSTYIQQEVYESNPMNKVRSIVVDTYDINPIDFNITEEDEKYQILYNQGFKAAKTYFDRAITGR
jgi:NTE family protein